MNKQTAQEIVDMVYGDTPRVMEAIKMLRMETSLGLHDAKMMLYGFDTKEALFAELCTNFVEDKKDLLRLAIAERDRLDKYIAQLEMEILDEESV